VAIPSALVGLGICVVCVLLFPIGLLGFPFAIGFFIPLMSWLGWIGSKGMDVKSQKTAEKFIQGQYVPDDQIISAVNNLMESKKESDRRLGLLARSELEIRRQKHNSDI